MSQLNLPTSTRLLIASGNAGKIAEIAHLLAGLPVEVVGLDAYPDMPELPEPFNTFAENAVSKARAAATFAGCLALADDSGLQVTALDGRPGVLSARYADTDEQRIARLLAEMQGLVGAQREARFVCAIALVNSDRVLGQWEGVCEGVIAETPAGENGFGFDPIFMYEGRTFAELSAEEKNAVSHRGRALRVFAADFPRIIHDLT